MFHRALILYSYCIDIILCFYIIFDILQYSYIMVEHHQLLLQLCVCEWFKPIISHTCQHL